MLGPRPAQVSMLCEPQAVNLLGIPEELGGAKHTGGRLAFTLGLGDPVELFSEMQCPPE